MNQDDEGGILVEFLYARLRANSGSWPVVPMPCAPDQAYPAFGFSIAPLVAVPEQGGEILYSVFQVAVVAIGQGGVNNLQPLRVMAKEAAAALRTVSGEPGTAIGDGMILGATPGLPVVYEDRDAKGIIHWHLGRVWNVKVQPDATAH